MSVLHSSMKDKLDNLHINEGAQINRRHGSELKKEEDISPTLLS